VKEINQGYNLSIAATRIYDYPTIRELAKYLQKEIGKEEVNQVVRKEDVKQVPGPDKDMEKIDGIKMELKRSLAEALFMDIDEVDTNKDFVDLGLDSVVGVEWINSLNTKYGTSVTATKIYDHPNINELAKFFSQVVYSKKETAPEKTTTLNSIDVLLQQVKDGVLDAEVANKMLLELNN